MIEKGIKRYILHSARIVNYDKASWLMSLYFWIGKINMDLYELKDYLYNIKFRRLVKLAFTPRILNFILLVCVYSYVLWKSNISQAILITKQNISVIIFYLYDTIRHFSSKMPRLFWALLAAPVWYNTYSYIIMKLFKENQNLNPYIEILFNIQRKLTENLEEIKFRRRDLIDDFLKDLTDGLPYKIENSKLVSNKKRFDVNLYGKDKVNIESIKFESQQLKTIFNQDSKNRMWNNRFVNSRVVMIEEFIYKISQKYYGLLYLEGKVLYEIDEKSKLYKCKSYFNINHNKIYKRKFTKARVIREDILDKLDYYEQEVLRHVNNYLNNIDDYIFGLVENKAYLEKLLRKIKKEIYEKDMLDNILIITKYSVKDYITIISRLFI